MSKQVEEQIIKIREGLAKGGCEQCTANCKRPIRCKWFNATPEFMERVREEVCGGQTDTQKG